MVDGKSATEVKREWRYERWKRGEQYVEHAFVWGPKVTVHDPGGNLDESESDMRLIAAAPDLLKALRQMIVNAEGDKKQYRDCYKKAIAAVAKAEGRE